MKCLFCDAESDLEGVPYGGWMTLASAGGGGGTPKAKRWYRNGLSRDGKTFEFCVCPEHWAQVPDAWPIASELLRVVSGLPENN